MSPLPPSAPGPAARSRALPSIYPPVRPHRTGVTFMEMLVIVVIILLLLAILIPLLMRLR